MSYIHTPPARGIRDFPAEQSSPIGGVGGLLGACKGVCCAQGLAVPPASCHRLALHLPAYGRLLPWHLLSPPPPAPAPRFLALRPRVPHALSAAQAAGRRCSLLRFREI